MIYTIHGFTAGAFTLAYPLIICCIYDLYMYITIIIIIANIHVDFRKYGDGVVFKVCPRKLGACGMQNASTQMSGDLWLKKWLRN